MSQMSENEIPTQEHPFPNGFLELYSVLNIETACEGLALLLHALLLDVGFIPKDVTISDVHTCMPENWKSSGIFKIQYYYKDIPEALCWVTSVPLYNNFSVQGTLVTEKLQNNSVHLKLKVNSYVNVKEDCSNASKLFTNVKKLTRIFKDDFCFPLLALLQESVNCNPLFGLAILVDEAKLSILKLLPVESVVSLSGANKDFHIQANSPYLWKYMFLRDFGANDPDVSLTSSEEDWKEMYKEEYLKRKTRLHPIYPPLLMPHIFPMAPDFNFDLNIDMDPALQLAFPHMRSRFRPANWPYPFPYPPGSPFRRF